MDSPNMKSYDEKRYENLLETLDEYIFCGDDINMLLPDLRRALAQLKKHPLTQVKRITRLQQLLGVSPDEPFVIED